jgi:hypothetical protein
MNKAEIEKEIEKLRKKVYKRLGTNKCPDKDYAKMRNWEEYYDGDLISLNIKLSQRIDDEKEFKKIIYSVFDLEEDTLIIEQLLSSLDNGGKK